MVLNYAPKYFAETEFTSYLKYSVDEQKSCKSLCNENYAPRLMFFFFNNCIQ